MEYPSNRIILSFALTIGAYVLFLCVGGIYWGITNSVLLTGRNLAMAGSYCGIIIVAHLLTELIIFAIKENQ